MPAHLFQAPFFQASCHFLRARSVGLPLVTLAFVVVVPVSGCKSPRVEEKPATTVDPSPEQGPTSEAEVAALQLEPVDGIEARAVARDLTGRFDSRPALVASPCGFYLVASGPETSSVVLLPGRTLAWSPDGSWLSVDGLVMEVGLVSSSSMGGTGALRGQELLRLYGQWETEWLEKEAGGGKVEVVEHARGSAQRHPGIFWQVWSAKLGEPIAAAGRSVSRTAHGVVALGDHVLVLRAIAPDSERMQTLVRRLVFAVDSLDLRQKPTTQAEFLASLREAAVQDPECASVLETHAALLE